MTHVIIQWIHSSGSLAAFNVSSRKSHMIMSYAFSKSNFSSIQPFRPFFLLIECSTSWTITMLSELNRPGMKLDCAGPISCGITCFNLITIALVIVLNNTLHKLIGRNCFIFSGFPTFAVMSMLRKNPAQTGSPTVPQSPNSLDRTPIDTHLALEPYTFPYSVWMPPLMHPRTVFLVSAFLHEIK